MPRKPLKIVDKEDMSPVTEIDRKVEMSLRNMIHEAFPDHSVFGEEYGMENRRTEEKNYLWVLDPIDGTLSFITGHTFADCLCKSSLQGSLCLGH